MKSVNSGNKNMVLFKNSTQLSFKNNASVLFDTSQNITSNANIKDTINHATNKSMNHAINKNINHTTNKSINYATNKNINQITNKSIDNKTDRNINRKRNIIAHQPNQKKIIIHTTNIGDNTGRKNFIIASNHIQQSTKKRILICQYNNMHTEVIGFLIQNMMEYVIDIYHPHSDNASNCLPYYEKNLKKSINIVSDYNESTYNLIFMLTGGEVKQLTPINKSKYILINHENDTFDSAYFNISLTPIVKSNMWMLPVYKHINNLTRKNYICIIGSMKPHQRDISNIFKLISNCTNYTIHIFTRSIDSETKDKIKSNKNVELHERCSTDRMIDIVRLSKFMYVADTINYSENGIRGGIMTGMIPLGINNNVPLILTNKLNIIYGLSGVITYDANIMEIINKINMDSKEYSDLVKKSRKDCDDICAINALKFDILKLNIK